jgi:hypothetical protein
MELAMCYVMMFNSLELFGYAGTATPTAVV